MLRQLGRLRLSALAGAGPAAAAAAAGVEGSAAGRAPHASAAAMQLLDRWQHWGGSQGGAGGAPHQHAAVRHMSLWSGGGGSKDDQAAAAAGAGPDSLAAAGDAGLSDGFGDAAAAAAAAAPAADPMGAGLFSASAIVAAAAGAEGDVLAAAREDSWLGTRLVQGLLVAVHDGSGLPWWQAIAVATAMMRVATLPVMLAQIKNTYKLSLARPEMEQLVELMKQEQARGNADAAMQHQARVMAVWEKYDCNPFKSLLGMFVQAPIFIGFFSALRGFAAHKLPSLAEGGALWFTDLTVPDPTYALPALAGLTFLATVELGAADGMEGQTAEMRKKMKNMMRGVALLIPLVSTSMPASVFCYWTASNIFSLCQSAVLKVPGVKRVLGLPDLSALRKPSVAATAAASSAAGKPVQTFRQNPAQQRHAAAEAAASEDEAAAAAEPAKPAVFTQRPVRPKK